MQGQQSGSQLHLLLNHARERTVTVRGEISGTLAQWAQHPDSVKVSLGQLVNNDMKRLKPRQRRKNRGQSLSYDLNTASLTSVRVTAVKHNLPVEFVASTNFVPTAQKHYVKESMQSFRQAANYQGMMAKAVVQAASPPHLNNQGQPNLQLDKQVIWLLEKAEYGPTSDMWLKTFKPLNAQVINRGLEFVTDANQLRKLNVLNEQGAVWVPEWHVLACDLRQRQGIRTKTSRDGRTTFYLVTKRAYGQLLDDTLQGMCGQIDTMHPKDFELIIGPVHSIQGQAGPSWLGNVTQEQAAMPISIQFTISLSYIVFPREIPSDALPGLQLPTTTTMQAEEKMEVEEDD